MVNSTGYTQRYCLEKKEKYESREIRESLEIKRSKCDNSKSNINHHEGNLVKTNTWTPLLKKINNIDIAL